MGEEKIETLVGKLGLDRLLEPKSLRITKSDIASMVKFDKSITPVLREFLSMEAPDAFKLPKSQIKVSDFDAIIADLNQELPFDAMVTKLKNFTSDEASTFLTTYMHMIHQLQLAKPPTETIGVLGIEPSEPSDEEKIEFVWLCRLVSDVGWLFTLLKANHLTQSEVELFQQTYPDTYDEIMFQLTSLLTTKSKEEISGLTTKWQLSGLAAMAMTPEVTTEELTRMQMTYLEQEEPEGGAPKTKGDSPVDPANGLTESQRIEGA